MLKKALYLANFLQKLPMIIQQCFSKINTLLITKNTREYLNSGDLQDSNFTMQHNKLK